MGQGPDSHAVEADGGRGDFSWSGLSEGGCISLGSVRETEPAGATQADSRQTETV